MQEEAFLRLSFGMQVFPDLKGKLNGLAVRVPLTNGSITDCVFDVSRPTTREEVNSLLKAASQTPPLKGILGFEDRPLVSTDYVNDDRYASSRYQPMRDIILSIFHAHSDHFSCTIRSILSPLHFIPLPGPLFGYFLPH